MGDETRFSYCFFISQTLHGTAIYAYIDTQNHPNVSIYGSPMECLGIVFSADFELVSLNKSHQMKT